MDEVQCPRCKGRGDIPALSGAGMTKCFACGGRGVINKRDLEFQSKWSSSSDTSTKATRGAKPTKAGAEKTPRPRVARTKVTTVLAEIRGRTPLHREASDGFTRGVQELLASGADVNARDDDGRTPLHWPAYRGHLEVVRLLIEHGADVNAIDNSGRTPLKMATIGNHPDVVAFLTEHGGQ